MNAKALANSTNRNKATNTLTGKAVTEILANLDGRNPNDIEKIIKKYGISKRTLQNSEELHNKLINYNLDKIFKRYMDEKEIIKLPDGTYILTGKPGYKYSESQIRKILFENLKGQILSSMRIEIEAINFYYQRIDAIEKKKEDIKQFKDLKRELQSLKEEQQNYEELLVGKRKETLDLLTAQYNVQDRARTSILQVSFQQQNNSLKLRAAREKISNNIIDIQGQIQSSQQNAIELLGFQSSISNDNIEFKSKLSEMQIKDVNSEALLQERRRMRETLAQQITSMTSESVSNTRQLSNQILTSGQEMVRVVERNTNEDMKQEEIDFKANQEALELSRNQIKDAITYMGDTQQSSISQFGTDLQRGLDESNESYRRNLEGLVKGFEQGVWKVTENIIDATTQLREPLSEISTSLSGVIDTQTSFNSQLFELGEGVKGLVEKGKEVAEAIKNIPPRACTPSCLASIESTPRFTGLKNSRTGATNVSIYFCVGEDDGNTRHWCATDGGKGEYTHGKKSIMFGQPPDGYTKTEGATNWFSPW